MAYTTVPKSSDYFNNKLYTGNGGTQTISGIGFEPSLAWFKTRSSTSHMLQDQCRGKTKFLESNNTTGDQTSSDGISSFNSDGYAIGANGRLNSNNTSMVSWNWKANGAGSANTDGSINSTKTSANTTSKFSIVTYTAASAAAATIGHGLGVVPSLIIIKCLNQTESWCVYHKSLGATKNMTLNSTAAVATSAAEFNNTAPTSSVFTVSGNSDRTGGGLNYVAYCAADVQGFSKMGFYDGNGSAEGVFEYLGFKPAFLLIKNTTATEAWFLYDNKRGYNGSMAALFPDEVAAEASANNIDFLSNGFKLRTGGAILNGNTTRYIYMAFAESPFVSTNNAAATAR